MAITRINQISGPVTVINQTPTIKLEIAKQSFPGQTQGNGINRFTQLQDTPSAYTGLGGQFVRVGIAETGLEAADIPYGAVSGLSGVPADRFLRTAAGGELEARTASQFRSDLSLGTAALTTMTTSRTDTTGDRTLKRKDFGLGVTTTQENIGSNFNTPRPTGFYRGNGSGSSNYPGGTAFGATIVAHRFEGTVFRLSMTADQLWLTQHDETGAQTAPACEMFNRLNVLAAVSGAAGEANGGIIQRGSNSNGSFVRFADGTQICWRSITVADTDSVQEFAFPAAFTDTPACSLSGSGTTERPTGGTGIAPRYRAFIYTVVGLVFNGTQWAVLRRTGDFAHLSGESFDAYDAVLMAIGRWN